MSIERSRHETAERWYFLVITGLAWAHVVLRAVWVPLIHDEANSYWWYASTGEFIPFQSHENTGNHLLGSLLGWVGQGLFGPAPWALRLGSVWAFVLYAWSSWKLSAWIGHAWVRRATLLALIWCPFGLEYFALFRGYGLGLACFTWALLQLVRTVQRPSLASVGGLGLAMLGATLANLSYVTIWSVMLGLSLSLLVLHRKQPEGGLWKWVLLYAAQLLCLWAAARLVLHYADGGQLDFGHHKGFLLGTLEELVQYLTGAPGILSVIIVMLVLSPATAVALWRIRSGRWTDPLVVLCALCWSEIIGRWALHTFFTVMPPPARAALYMAPLLVLITGLTIDRGAAHRPWVQLAAVLLLALPARSIITLGYEGVTNSGAQAVPTHFAAYAAQLQERLGRPLMVGVGGAMRPAWAYQQFRYGTSVNDAQPEQQWTDQDLRLRPVEDTATNKGYRRVAMEPTDRLVLWERITPMQLILELDTLLPDRTTEDEFIALYDPKGGFKDTALWVRLTGELDVVGNVHRVTLVAHEDSAGTPLSYDNTELWHQPRSGTARPLDLMRQLPGSRGAASRQVYLWDPDRKAIRWKSVRLRVYRLAVQDPPHAQH